MAHNYSQDMALYFYMVQSHKGKDRAVNYAFLLKIIHNGFAGQYLFVSKDALRTYLNDLFDRFSEYNYTLISTAKGVFVAENKQEIIECAERIRNHAMGELKKYAKLMKLPLDNQLLVNLDTDKIETYKRG